MGGIAIFLGEARDHAHVVETMSLAAPHRGARVETLVHGDCGLSCSNAGSDIDAELAISNGIAVAFTGTLDNSRQLVKDLERLNAPPTGGGAAALIAAAFRAYGEELLTRLRGVFAGALTTGDRVFCFRDQLGYAPLFYRSDARGFFAASEAKQVIAGAGISKEPDIDVVERILFGNIDDETPSALRGVQRLPKASVVSADGRGTRLRRYWWPESVLETAKFSGPELQERFDVLMDQAASRCVTGQDVISLSGGVDSPAIAAFAAPRHLELSGRPLHALSAVFPRFPSVDERRYVELVSERLGLPLQVYEQRVNPLDRLAEWVALADGPFRAASLAQYEELYRFARENGFRTVLTGEAAEFVFNMRTHMLGHLLMHARFRAAQRELRTYRRRGTPVWMLPVIVARGLAPRAAIAAKRRRTRIAVPVWVDLRRANEAAAASHVKVKERWRKFQLSAFIGPGLSGEADEICQTVCGVRTRRPWTDVDLFEFFLSLPAEVKFPDLRDKSFVRSLLRGRVPDEILDRRDKTVFDAAVLADLDFATLRRFLVNPSYRLPGIDYGELAQRLHRERLESIQEYVWVRNLAAAHAFLSQW